jgi:hypothetical protein
MKKLFISSLFFVFAFLSTNVSGQDAVKMPIKNWYNVLHIKWKVDMAGQGEEIMTKYFLKTDEMMGRIPLMFKPVGGDWDWIIFMPVEDPMAELTHSMSPSNIEWWGNLIKVTGSEEKATELWRSYLSSVANHKFTMVREMDTQALMN